MDDVKFPGAAKRLEFAAWSRRFGRYVAKYPRSLARRLRNELACDGQSGPPHNGLLGAAARGRP